MPHQELVRTRKVTNITKLLYADVFRRLIFLPSSPKSDHKEIQQHEADKSNLGSQRMKKILCIHFHFRLCRSPALLRISMNSERKTQNLH